jgi:hypothetical protein
MATRTTQLLAEAVSAGDRKPGETRRIPKWAPSTARKTLRWPRGTTRSRGWRAAGSAVASATRLHQTRWRSRHQQVRPIQSAVLDARAQPPHWATRSARKPTGPPSRSTRRWPRPLTLDPEPWRRPRPGWLPRWRRSRDRGLRGRRRPCLLTAVVGGSGVRLVSEPIVFGGSHLGGETP